jgi:hypothetical protein
MKHPDFPIENLELNWKSDVPGGSCMILGMGVSFGLENYGIDGDGGRQIC